MSEDRNADRPPECFAALIEQNRKLPLGSYLRELARASVMASVMAAGGCGGSETTWIDPAQAILPICEATAADTEGPLEWRPTQGLTPASVYDSLGVFGCSPGPGSAGYLLDWDGQPCEANNDPNYCEMLLQGAVNCPSLRVDSGGVVDVFTQGDDLTSFFGTVDTAQEALLVAFLHGNTVRCGDATLGSAQRVADGFEVIVTRLTAICDPVENSRFLFHVAADGSVTELRSEVYDSVSGLCIGRRPDGLARHEPCRSNTRAGTHFARIATLEAAAVVAFERLADELERLGAPPALVEDARKVAQDEVRHAQVMTEVARHFGSEPNAPSVALAEPRDPYSIAIENAVEGSVRETFGALAGSYQALAATEPMVAEAMRTVSEDEIFHAELSAKVDEFLHTRLTESERASVAKARRRAIAELRLEMSIEPDDEIAKIAGLPPRELALRWIDCLQRDVWAA